MRRDRIANEKVIDFFVPQAIAIGTGWSAAIDLRDAPPVVGAPGGGQGREIHTNILFSLSIGAHDAAAGWTATVQVNTGDTIAGLALYATSALMAQTDGEDLYLMEIRDLQRWMRVGIVVAGHALTCCLLGNADRSRREPVWQLGTEVAMTYARSPALALTGP